MRFKATYRVNQHPELTGCLTLGKNFNYDKNCFEFNVSDVKVLNSQKTEVDVTLITRKNSKDKLYDIHLIVPPKKIVLSGKL